MRDARRSLQAVLRLLTICFVIACAAGRATAQPPPRPDGWVVIPVEDYRALRLRAFPPTRPPAPPPIEAAITRVEYELRAAETVVSGEARVTVDVLAEGWVRVDVPAGLLVRGARIEGRAIPIVQTPAPHLLLSKPGRVVIALDVVVPLSVSAGVETITIPASRGAVSRVAMVVPREGIAVSVAGGVLAERAQQPAGRWVAFGRAGQPLTMTWKRRAEERSASPLKWRGGVTALVGLGEDASSLSASIQIEVTQGAAAFVDVDVPDGATVNEVAGPLVADWDVKPGGPLRVSFLEPLVAGAAFTITGELRAPRDGAVSVPLIRLRSAERETGGSRSKYSAPGRSPAAIRAASIPPTLPSWRRRSAAGSRRRCSRSPIAPSRVRRRARCRCRSPATRRTRC